MFSSPLFFLVFIVFKQYSSLMKTYLSIDRGASYTDFVVLASNNEIISTTCLPARDWTSIRTAYQSMKQKFVPEEIFFTGSTKDFPLEFKEKFHRIDEIDAIAFGGSFVSGKKRCIVVSMGTGTAIALFDNGRTAHISGTGVGGGTISGLGKLLTDTAEPLLLNHLALQGNASRLNLTLSDVGYGQLGLLSGDLTASNFGKITSKRKEDISAAILSLTAEVIGVIASLSAKLHHLEKDIVIIGNVSRSNYIRKALQNVGALYQTSFCFPENPEYAAAIGAVKSFFNNAT